MIQPLAIAVSLPHAAAQWFSTVSLSVYGRALEVCSKTANVTGQLWIRRRLVLLDDAVRCEGAIASGCTRTSYTGLHIWFPVLQEIRICFREGSLPARAKGLPERCNCLDVAKIHSGTSWVRLSLPHFFIPHTYIAALFRSYTMTAQSSPPHTIIQTNLFHMPLP